VPFGNPFAITSNVTVPPSGDERGFRRMWTCSDLDLPAEQLIGTLRTLTTPVHEHGGSQSASAGGQRPEPSDRRRSRERPVPQGLVNCSSSMRTRATSNGM